MYCGNHFLCAIDVKPSARLSPEVDDTVFFFFSGHAALHFSTMVLVVHAENQPYIAMLEECFERGPRLL